MSCTTSSASRSLREITFVPIFTTRRLYIHLAVNAFYFLIAALHRTREYFFETTASKFFEYCLSHTTLGGHRIDKLFRSCARPLKIRERSLEGLERDCFGIARETERPGTLAIGGNKGRDNGRPASRYECDGIEIALFFHFDEKSEVSEYAL